MLLNQFREAAFNALSLDPQGPARSFPSSHLSEVKNVTQNILKTLQNLFILNGITQFKCCSVQYNVFSFMLFPAPSFILTTAMKITTFCSEVSNDFFFSLSMFLVCNYQNINVTTSCTLQVHEVRFLGGGLQN